MSKHQVKLLNYEINKISTISKNTVNSSKIVSDSIWALGAPIYWSQGIKGSGCIIGVLDTGIDSTHIDLKSQIIKRRDYVKDGVQPHEFNPHGTHVAGIIAANGRMLGIAPDAKLIDYRVLDKNGVGYTNDVAQAIRDSVSDGCKIINLSLGSSSDDTQLHNAVKYAVFSGVLVIVAVGNEGPGMVSYPAYYPEVLGVGAVQFNPKSGDIIFPEKHWFSNSNSEVDLCADGWKVLSTFSNNRYARLTGTSMASPHITGAAALLWNKCVKRGRKSPDQKILYNMLKTITFDVYRQGNDFTTGAGFVTFYPCIPKKVNGNWIIPGMSNYAP